MEIWIGGGLCIVIVLYILVCFGVYWRQEQLLFHPTPLEQATIFPFDTNFEELYFEVEAGIQLHALHFKARASKGLVFYVHGNAGSLYDWGSLSEFYVQQGYDLLMFDYRGFGKSTGRIHSQQQFFDDVQKVYDWAKEQYTEAQIIVEGFSIGTATATKIAAENKPQHLVLKAPYYSMTSLVQSKFPFLPSFLLKYRFATIDYLQQVACPVTLFHGTTDELIPYSNSEQLKAEVPRVELYLVEGCLHNDIPYTAVYQQEMKNVLNKK